MSSQSTPTPQAQRSDSIQLLSPAGLVASPAFSHVAVIPPDATTILVGGQNGVDATGAVVGPDTAGQTGQAMTNLETALAAAGATMADVVSMTLLLAEEADLGAGYAAARPFLDQCPTPPLITAARVRSLTVPGALVELSAVAAVVR
ncbi:RidA family protein [Intrasporangium sp.]|uniref:RidA family protein n=1 Tax=Intrasporangium sp. TaxID=1925024 RepID=UPI0029395EB6|nr:RidA family protein [Intrasporangium sp.]MDV3222059.1 RidA family protein [Intrasporangium sp.]